MAAQHRVLGVLSPLLDTHYYFVGVLAGIHQAAQQHGFRVVGVRAARPDVIAPPSLAWQQVDGWIVIMHSEGIHPMAETGVPLVTIGGAHTPGLTCPSVMPDNFNGMHAATAHLIEHGHRRIAFVGSLENPDIWQRYEGYCAALAAHNLPLLPELVIRCGTDGHNEPDGRWAAHQLLAHGLPCSAVVAATDQIAIGLIDTVQQAGYRVPADLAVVGFDDLYAAQSNLPPLTTVRHPFEALGRTATELLLAQIAGETVPPDITSLATQLITRRSCGCDTLRDALATPLLHPHSADWQRHLAEQLVQAMRPLGPFPPAVPPEEIWPGVRTLVEGLDRALRGAADMPGAALHQAWQEAIVRLPDLELLHALVRLLERTGTLGESDPTRLRLFLDRNRAEMLRAYQAQALRRNRALQRAMETNARIGEEISSWLGQGTSHGSRLAWLRHLAVRWGVLGRWTERDAGPAGVVVVADTYSRDAALPIPIGSQIAAAQFPALAALPQQDASEFIALVPFQTPGQEWWVLALCLTPETHMQAEREYMGAWIASLGAALEREALLSSLAEGQRQLQASNQALLLAKESAEQANQLKTRLLANVSHELRTPVQTILGYGRAALELPDHTPAPRSDLRQIVRSGEHLGRLINDLLDLARAEVDALELAPEPLDVHAALRDTFASIAEVGVLPGAVSWRLALPARLPLIEADPVRLRQIVLNLLSNAQKFTPAGQITLGAEVAPPHLHIWVQDSGVGIPAELQERIFEPFVSTARAQRQEGVGLGLSITRRLVALHNGSLSLESAPGRGSTFHVSLPLPSLGEQMHAPAHSAAPALLLIGDEHAPPPEVAELCGRQNLRLVALRPGGDLAALLAAVQPTALAWDLALAQQGDWQLVQQIRAHPQLCQLPCLMFTGQTGHSSQPGVTGVVLKPLQSATLAEMITALLPAYAAEPIVIVDDDPQARALYAQVISASLPCYPVVHAEGGAAALALLARMVPCLLILDLMMPDVDGFAVLQHLRADERTRHVPVLVMSGHVLSLDDIRRLDFARVSFQSKDILSPEETAASMQRLLGERDLLPPQTSALIRRTLAFLHAEYARPLSSQEIARAVGAHKNYLSAIFTRELGISLGDYLNRFRVRQAKLLLRTTSTSITDLAQQVGFQDASYFGRVFHKHVGCSPRAYRELPEARTVSAPEA